MKISDVMTTCPYRVEADSSLSDALNMMQMRNIRHLPVIEQNELIGIISEAGINVAMALAGSSSKQRTVREVCTKDPYLTDTGADVGEVAREMAERKVDCALVSDEQSNFVGVFTTTDCCRLIHLILEEMRNSEEE